MDHTLCELYFFFKQVNEMNLILKNLLRSSYFFTVSGFVIDHRMNDKNLAFSCKTFEEFEKFVADNRLNEAWIFSLEIDDAGNNNYQIKLDNENFMKFHLNCFNGEE